MFSTAFCYAKHSKGMKEITGFGIKNSITLPSLANKFFNSLRKDNQEPIYTDKDEYMPYFARNSLKVGMCVALNQCIISVISDEVFNIISKELNIFGNICEILDEYFETYKKT